MGVGTGCFLRLAHPVGWTQQEALGEIGRRPHGRWHPGQDNVFEMGTACSKVPSSPSLLCLHTFKVLATSHALQGSPLRKFSPKLALCAFLGASENVPGPPIRVMAALVTFTLPTPRAFQLHFPSSHSPALGPEQAISGAEEGPALGAPLSPTAVLLVPVRALQLSASRGKDSPPGNCWSGSLDFGRRESLVARASSHSFACPSEVLSSLLSPPHGFQKSSLTSLPTPQHVGPRAPQGRPSWPRQVQSGLGTPRGNAASLALRPFSNSLLSLSDSLPCSGPLVGNHSHVSFYISFKMLPFCAHIFLII